MPDRACPAKGEFQGCVQAVRQQVHNTEQTQESRFGEGDEDGGKLCVYGEQTPGRSGGGRKGAGWKKKGRV